MDPDEEIFASAVADDPAPTPAEPSPASEPAPQPEQSGPTRDEHGRFAPAPAPEPEPEPAPAAPAADRQDGAVPPGRLREVNEARRAAEARAAELERRLAALEAQPRAPAQAEPEVDQFGRLLDKPDEFIAEHASKLLSPVQAEVAKMREHYSRREAVREHGQEAVKSAYDAMQDAIEAGDPAAIAALQRVKHPANLDPYGDLVAWHKTHSVVSEVTKDPEGYRNRVLDEALKDPAFLQRATEALRGAPPARGAGPALNLPPSLSRAASAAAAVEADDASDAGLFAYATR